MKVEKRFWSKVNKSEGDGCWIWTGCKTKNGYGRFLFDGKVRIATRIALILSGKTPPEGLLILHKCDNPPCVNPGHLFVGTMKDNQQDAAAKGRFWIQRHPEKGEDSRNSRLTNAQAVEIRMLSKQGHGRRELADKFCVCYNSIRNIELGVTYK